MSKRSNAKRRNQLWAINPYCSWCGVFTINPPGDVPFVTPPPNLATADHLYSRNDPRRKHWHPSPIVLACYACNQKRGQEEHAHKRSTFTLHPRSSIRKPREYITQNSLRREQELREAPSLHIGDPT